MKIILAHRGVIEENKENTLGSLKAIKKYSNTTDIGFGVEFDINLTSDLQLVLYHDEYIKGTENKIIDLTYTKLKSLDKVAYIRFASVYRDFTELDDFRKEIRVLVSR